MTYPIFNNWCVRCDCEQVHCSCGATPESKKKPTLQQVRNWFEESRNPIFLTTDKKSGKYANPYIQSEWEEFLASNGPLAAPVVGFRSIADWEQHYFPNGIPSIEEVEQWLTQKR